MRDSEGSTNRATGFTERVAIGQGAAAAVGAYLLGYLLTYVTQVDVVRDRLRTLNFLADLFGGETVAAWQGVGWYFYSAHFVATVSPTFGGGARSTNFVATADANLTYLYLVPPVALLLAGAAVSVVKGVESPRDGAVAALGVVPGYFVLALVGAFLFAYSVGDGGSVHPDYVTAALLAGIVYPAVFGSIGGALGSLARAT